MPPPDGAGEAPGGGGRPSEFTEQKLSAHAGSATFWGGLRLLDVRCRLEHSQPHSVTISRNPLLLIETDSSFVHGIRGDGWKLTHVATLRRDSWVPKLWGIERVASQSSLSRFFWGRAGAGDHQGLGITKVWAPGRRAVKVWGSPRSGLQGEER